MKVIKRFVKRAARFLIAQGKVIKVNAVSIPPSDLLKERTALITGATSGIGFEIAKAFLNAGANVVITGRYRQRIDTALHKLQATHFENHVEIYGFVMDMSNTNNIDLGLREIINEVGKIDILVNNAGILGGDLSHCTEQEYDAIMNTNLKGPFFLSRLVARHMRDNHLKGNILNIASSSSLRPANSAYALSKWGIRGFTMGLARMLAPLNIVVNGIAPGPTATPMIMDDTEDANFNPPKSLAGRLAIPSEIANMAVILCSEMSRMIIGDIVYMTGGAGIINNEDMTYLFD